jgi:hypothetical protein
MRKIIRADTLVISLSLQLARGVRCVLRNLLYFFMTYRIEQQHIITTAIIQPPSIYNLFSDPSVIPSDISMHTYFATCDDLAPFSTIPRVISDSSSMSTWTMHRVVVILHVANCSWSWKCSDPCWSYLQMQWKAYCVFYWSPLFIEDQ